MPFAIPDFFAVTGPLFVGFGLVATRMAGLVTTLPILSSRAVPPRAKAAFIAITSVLVLLRIDVDLGFDPGDGGAVITAALVEFAAGATMGLTLAVLWGAMSLGGQLVGVQMGFAIANVMDPATFQSVGIVAQMLNLLGLLLLLAFDMHLHMLRMLFESYGTVPLGTPYAAGPTVAALVGEFMRLGGRMFALGLRVALPVMCVVLVVNCGLAVVARTVPQVNVFVIGFILTIGAGIMVLALAVPAVVPLVHALMEEALATVRSLVTAWQGGASQGH